jgi:hypothetical protein
MASIFCSSCGSKAEYKFSAPNFCGKCGSSYSPQRSIQAKKISSPVLERNVSRDDEDDEYNEEDGDELDSDSFSNSNHVPRIRKLNVDIDLTPAFRTTTIGEIFGESRSNNFQISKRKDLEDLRNNRDLNE